MRVGIVGCGGHRTGGWGHPPLRRVTIDFVGAAVLSGPSITGAPPWSPSSVMGFAHATFPPAGRRLWLFRRERSDVDGVPLIRHGCAVPPSPGGRLFGFTPAPRPGSSSSKTRSSRPGCRCGRPGTGWPRGSAPPPPHTAWPRRRRTAAMASAPGRSPPPAR